MDSSRLVEQIDAFLDCFANEAGLYEELSTLNAIYQLVLADTMPIYDDSRDEAQSLKAVRDAQIAVGESVLAYLKKTDVTKVEQFAREAIPVSQRYFQALGDESKTEDRLKGLLETFLGSIEECSRSLSTETGLMLLRRASILFQRIDSANEQLLAIRQSLVDS